MSRRLLFVAFGLGVGLALDAAVTLAWTGPTASAPGNNTGAPVNVGTNAQSKNGSLGVNESSAPVFPFEVNGDSWLQGSAILYGSSRYLNFGTSAGTSGYGLRDNAGTLEFKNSGGSWQSLQSLVSSLAGFWTAGSGGAIYYNGGNVGINTATPNAKLNVNGDIVTDTQGYIRSRYSGATDSYRGSFGWNSIQLGNNGPNFIVAGNTAAGGSLNFVVNNSNEYKYGVNSPNGATAMTILANGAVGINNTNPVNTLHVGGNIGATGWIGAGCEVNCETSGGYSILYANGQSVFTNSSWAPVFYDLDNSGYYVDPAAGSSLNYATANDWYANSWYRVNGAGGIYWQLYGGGWYMQDSTWIRTYNGKYVYMSAGFDTAGGSAVGCSGALGGGYVFRVCGSANAAIFYDYNDPSYYVDPNWASRMGYINSTGYWHMADRYYDDDNGYYIDSNTGSSINYIYANAYYYRSDKRLKDNIKHIDNALWKLLQIDGVSFTWNEKADKARVGKEDVGVIAQDVEKVYPQAVMTGEDGMKAVDYPRLTPLLINAIKEQQKEIDELKSEVAELKANR